MNKQELIRSMADQCDLNLRQCDEALSALKQVLHIQLKRGGEVSLPEIGKFSVAQRQARTGRNPQTGETVQIAARQVPKFSPAKALKEVVAK